MHYGPLGDNFWHLYVYYMPMEGDLRSIGVNFVPENPFGASRSRFFLPLGGGDFSSQGVSFRASVG